MGAAGAEIRRIQQNVVRARVWAAATMPNPASALLGSSHDVQSRKPGWMDEQLMSGAMITYFVWKREISCRKLRDMRS